MIENRLFIPKEIVKEWLKSSYVELDNLEAVI